MRHRNVGTVLGRTKAPREALLRNLAASVILFEKVRTTVAKAKAVRPLIERMITTGKTKNAVSARRTIVQRLYSENVGKKILEVLAPRYKTRKGGYVRITKIGSRKGDGADMAQIELV